MILKVKQKNHEPEIYPWDRDIQDRFNFNEEEVFTLWGGKVLYRRNISFHLEEGPVT